MANENEKNPSALEELRQLKRTDRIKSLDIHEPELKGFNAENIFHIDEEPEKKTLFGKRSAKTHVKINENIFDDEVSESVEITPNTSIEEVEAPIEKHTVEPVIGKRAEKVEVEEPKKAVVETIDADENFTTESIENELKTFNVNPVAEEEVKTSELIEEESAPVLSEEDIYDDDEDDEVEEDEDENLYEERKGKLKRI